MKNTNNLPNINCKYLQWEPYPSASPQFFVGDVPFCKTHDHRINLENCQKCAWKTKIREGE